MTAVFVTDVYHNRLINYSTVVRQVRQIVYLINF